MANIGYIDVGAVQRSGMAGNVGRLDVGAVRREEEEFRAYGEQAPDSDEMPKSWATWKEEGGGAVTVSGDPDWGSVEVVDGIPVYGPVEDTGDASSKTFHLRPNKYA